MSESTDLTESMSSGTLRSEAKVEVSMPSTIGRYEVKSVLGSGGFGTVFGAFDHQLQRRVAVKVPRSHRKGQHDFALAFLAEARKLARLDHPHIVPVYDYDSAPEFPCYIVSKYIDGQNLAERLSTLDWSWEQRAKLVATMADALHCAHLAGLVHRDVKPANVLLDQADNAFLADFGLALSDEDYDLTRSGSLVGTLNYMSPEQVRGEGHLVDGRADVFSLGVLMYELLTGVKPFSASTREQVIRNILDRDAKPLRLKVPNVPQELERICLRALEKRKSLRYSTALDFCEELRAYLASTNATESGPLSRVKPVSEMVESSAPEDSRRAAQSAGGEAAGGVPPLIVPKGLRAFDAEDADFFLHMLPGPKDRQGVSECLRFWKHRIEATNPEESFRVGVVYGPSGCGKSSLIRAGLLPLLSPHILPIMVSATARDTDERLERSLAAVCPEIVLSTDHRGLAEMLQTIRLQGPPASERTILLVIDQFEQWLSEHGQTDDSSLVKALRQCDGIKLKCLFLVRNDFWMSISRVMEQLESPIEQGRNSAAVELFDLRHAQRVLFAFGHAYDALPKKIDELTNSQQEFLEQSVNQLAEDGRVICVRLAVFAQMMRDKVWEPKTLAEFGGVSGLGARFLEETFYGSAAPPEHKQFQTAARDILRSLLPTPGTDIRGAMMAEQQLAEIAGPGMTDRQFKRLLRVLNDELRLLTPTDALGMQVSGDSEHSAQRAPVRYYQLTHDFLVPSLRAWLNAKQGETFAGRTQLCLQERTALWDISRESRQLPSWFETLRIYLWTSRTTWTASQAKMIQQAGRRWLGRTLTVGFLAVACMLVMLGVNEYVKKEAADQASRMLFLAKTNDVYPLLTALDRFQPRCDQDLKLIATLAPPVDSSESNDDADRRFRALLALGRSKGEWTDRLLSAAENASAAEIELIRKRIGNFASTMEDDILQKCRDTHNTPPAGLRYAAILSVCGPGALQKLNQESQSLCESLLNEDAQDIDLFADHISGITSQMKAFFETAFKDPNKNDNARTAAARVLSKTANDEELAELLLNATPSQHLVLMSFALKKQETVVRLIQSKLKVAFSKPGLTSAEKIERAHRIANGVIVLLKTEPRDERICQCLAEQTDPTARSNVIVQSYECGVPLEKILQAKDAIKGDRDPVNPIARQALILACEPYQASFRSRSLLQAICGDLQQLAMTCPHQSERCAAEWVLKQWKMPLAVDDIPRDAREVPEATSPRDWWITKSSGHLMVILTQPIYANGTSAGTPIGSRRFAISATEVSVAELRRFNPAFKFNPDVIGDNVDESPVNNIVPKHAVEYCRALSLAEHIPEQDMCYTLADETNQTFAIGDDRFNRNSYRLPTDAEWKFACCAGSDTRWSHGDDERQLVHFGWHSVNSYGRLHVVATLRPNAWGLFDMHGNVAEWCHATVASRGDGFRLSGGNYSVPPRSLASDKMVLEKIQGYSFTGFRIARTLSTVLNEKADHERP